jgi:hypothetical protein
MSTELNRPDRVARDVPGVVDTIGLAFGLLNRRPYLIWVVILVDILLWSGIEIRADRWTGSNRLPTSLATELESIGAIDMAAMLMPTLFDTLAVRGAETGSFVSVRSGVEGAGGTLILIGSMFAALLFAFLHLTVMTRMVRGERTTMSDVIRQPVVASSKMLAAMALTVALVLFLMSPFAAVSLGLEALGVPSTGLIVWSGIILSGWFGLFFIFSGAGFAGGQSGITAVMRSSYRVVLRNVLGLLGLILIILLIRLGLPFALVPFVESNWSIPFAIVVNAYVAAGLTASFVLFYQFRAHLIEPEAVIESPTK